MFAAFFYLLRQRGLNVSLNEWITLLEGMEKGLHHSTLTGFYHLCWAVVVKSETEFDRFDQVFLEFFKDVPYTGELPEELMNWLNHPSDDLRRTVEELRGAGFPDEDLETLLRIRLLRRLDVPIEEIRAMQAGKLSLSEALSQRLAALRRREEQARADQSVCRAMQADHACYDTLDAENYWRLLYTPPQAAAAAVRTDRQEPCPWRRFLARGLDMLLCSSAVALALMLGRIAPQTPGFSLLTYVG
ncbi:MAG: hypothetical protein EGQ09_24065, partial [Clostridiales bacterium]|nr:hypothetical protein [Clostridiales bacterium]